MMEWISVEDRLPAESMTVLVNVIGEYPIKTGMVYLGYWLDVAGNIYWMAAFPYIEKIDVTHWMPLPDPPSLDST